MFHSSKFTNEENIKRSKTFGSPDIRYDNYKPVLSFIFWPWLIYLWVKHCD